MRKLYLYSLRSPKQTESGEPEIKETELYCLFIDKQYKSDKARLNCYINTNTTQVYKRIFNPVEGLVTRNTVWFYDKPDKERARQLFLKDKLSIQNELDYPNGLVDLFVEFLSKTPV